MRVTDEMVCRAYDALPNLAKAVLSPGALGDVLEAALAAVPEPLDAHAVDELCGRWTAWAMQRASMQREEDDAHAAAANAYRQCVRELRERAKAGAPCA